MCPSQTSPHRDPELPDHSRLPEEKKSHLEQMPNESDLAPRTEPIEKPKEAPTASVASIHHKKPGFFHKKTG
jgi:hypothetical protein